MVTEQRKKELESKIEKSKEIVRQAFKKFDHKNLAITWTGGKDSTLTLWIMKKVCEEDRIAIPKVMTIDEGDAFAEIHDILTKYQKEWKLDMEWCSNKDVIDAAGGILGADVEVAKLSESNQREIKERLDYPGDKFPFEAESWIGNHLMKTVVFNDFLKRNNIKGMFMGIRWDEQAARVKDEYFVLRPGDAYTPEHTRIQPILHFAERDIWDTTLTYSIPYCALYKQGYRSLGAATTSVKLSDIPAWEQDLENTVERAGRRQDKEEAMERLRKLGYM
ncbi:MAG: phosphoadenosine phosphosulfate reductase family protein [Actinobacteria bacterium]|nr:phosphoadenosine phosphosulfate reductase family protein [Actinomycetota bacterium]